MIATGLSLSMRHWIVVAAELNGPNQACAAVSCRLKHVMADRDGFAKIVLAHQHLPAGLARTNPDRSVVGGCACP